MSDLHGMDVAEIESLGRGLQSGHASRVRDLVAEVDRLVGATSAHWIGPDAETFRSWWPAKKAAMLAMADDLHGFGQSALNNASEQRGASGEAISTGVSPTIPPPSESEAADAPLSGSGHARDSGYAGSFRGRGNAFLSAWKPNGLGSDQWNFAFDGDGDSTKGNCTSFVAWRLNQLGQEAGVAGYSFTNNHLTMNGERFDFGRLGNAGEWLGNAAAAGVDPVPTPRVGDVAVFTGGNHVAIVREVLPNGNVVIEESAWDRYTYQTRTIPAGQVSGFLRFLP